MDLIPRYYLQQPGNLLQQGKVLVIYGPRRVGKTTLIKSIKQSITGECYIGTGEDQSLQRILQSQELQKIISVFSKFKTVIIDEAQHIQGIGMGLKMMVDHIPGITIIASGSSSFDLSVRVGEPLTGRQRIAELFPLAVLELLTRQGPMDILGKLEEFLVYGMYPEIITSPSLDDKRDYLVSLRNSYLLKDILELDGVRNSSKIIDLLSLIAFQIGNDVSLNELGNSLKLAVKTVERYLDLLEKAFIIKKVRGFSRNLRKEVTKTARYYFLDNGVRNAVINNFNPVALRNDIGMLWENFIFSERLKMRTYRRQYANIYFWRTYDRKEIDLVEERDGKLFGYEIKWQKKKIKAPRLWTDTYDNASYECITQDNFLDFIT